MAAQIQLSMTCPLKFPLEIDLSGEGEVIILTQDIVANPATNEATEKELKAENEESVPATPRSRGRL